VYIGLLFTLSYLISFLYFTIILCCFIPFLMAPLSFYFALMWACLFGMAYREGAAKAGILSSATTSTSPLNSLPIGLCQSQQALPLCPPGSICHKEILTTSVLQRRAGREETT
jgi:hypothetical protein